MTLSNIQPEQAWRMVLDLLQMEMSKASFDTWVRDTEFVAFEDGILTVGTTNTYASEWLTSRLTSTTNRMLSGMLNQPVAVRFVVLEFTEENELLEDDSNRGEKPESDNPPNVLTLQAEYQSIYDEIVQPEQVIVVPGYFLRYIPILGVELAWLYIGFRQVAYEAGATRQPSKKFGAPAQKVARYSGMSLRTFRRYSAKPDTWKNLRGLVTPVEDKPRWQHGDDNHPHRTPRCFRVAMTLPLTPSDELSLRAWLYKRLAEGKNPLAILQDALEIPVDELIPRQENTSSSKGDGIDLHSIQDVLRIVCGPISENDRTQFQELADQLAQHLMPPRDLVFLTHYFVTRWLPNLGHGQGWFVVLLRDRCYLNRRTGEIRDEVQASQGYSEIAGWLGLKRIKTIWEWLRNNEVAWFVREISHEIGEWDESSRRFKVCLGEPMTEGDRNRANELLARRGFGANDTIRSDTISAPVGAIDTHNGATDTITGANDTIRSDMISAPLGAIDTHNGVIDTHNGANGSSIGGDDTHKIGAVVTFDWREWHSLNTLTLGLNHKKNTPTTTDDGADSDISTSRNRKGEVGIDGNISDLLVKNRVSAKNQELLLGKGLTVQAFVSWLLYAASAGGNGIRDPIAHTVSRLIQDPLRGAGGAYERLAGLPTHELTGLLQRELDGQNPWNTDWRTVMADTPRAKLRALADQLGVPVPKSNDW